MSTETIRPLELLQKYEREPTPQSPYPQLQREKQRDHAHRVEVARNVLTGRVPAKHLEDPEVREDLLTNKIFSRQELDELAAAAEIATEQAKEKRHRRDLNDQLRAARRQAERQLAAEEAAERERKIEALARKNLGWPKEGLPDE